MLERVGVQIALVERRVRAGVVGELEDLDLDPVLREQLLHQLGDLGVRPVLDAEADDVRRRGGRARPKNASAMAMTLRMFRFMRSFPLRGRLSRPRQCRLPK